MYRDQERFSEVARVALVSCYSWQEPEKLARL